MAVGVVRDLCHWLSVILLAWAHWLTVFSVHLILRAPNSPRTASGSASRWFRCLLLSTMKESFTMSVYVKCFITRWECEATFLKPKLSSIINADIPCVAQRFLHLFNVINCSWNKKKKKKIASLKRICTYKSKTCQHSWKARKEGRK